MDGNRRWAKEQGLSTFEGHAKGGEVFADSVTWVSEANIPHVVYYAFSTENWKRSEAEVAYLMELFADWLQTIERKINESTGDKVRVRVIGRRSDFSAALQTQMTELEDRTAANMGTTAWVALSYGGRVEIVEAVNKAVEKGEPVTEASFEKLLWTADLPDPDVIVRTSGEQRLSNFLTWRSVYSEFIFLEKHWPALTKADLTDILGEYEKRERRRGA